MTDARAPGRTAIAAKGWLLSHRWLLLRRISQAGILGLFLLGPVAGIWVVQGSLSASMTLDALPLTDPLLLLQSLASGTWPTLSGLTGAAIVAVFYALVGGRVFCAWVCPINPVTDLAAWLRRRLDLAAGGHPSRRLRYWVLALVLILPMLTGVMAWEFVNPVTISYRALLFEIGWAWTLVLGVFLFDLLVVRHGWCGHLCPVGAFYALLGTKALLRVAAQRRERCDGCLDCFAVCPEPQVITKPLKGAAEGIPPTIASIDCSNCGRCIDVCAKDVFRFQSRFAAAPRPETAGRKR